MRKVVGLITFAIFIAGVVVVGIYGMKMLSDKTVVYPTKVEITNTGIITANDGKKWLEAEVGDTLQLTWLVSPDNVTNAAVEFVYNTQSANTVSAEGLIEFKGFGVFTITIRTAANVEATDTINIDVGF